MTLLPSATLAVATSAVIIALGVLGHLSESTQTLFGTTHHFDALGIPHELSELPVDKGSGE